MRRPAVQDLLLAAEWLDENEGDADESEPMKRVAEWLRHTVAAIELAAAARKISRELGVTPSMAKRAIKIAEASV